MNPRKPEQGAKKHFGASDHELTQARAGSTKISRASNHELTQNASPHFFKACTIHFSMRRRICLAALPRPTTKKKALPPVSRMLCHGFCCDQNWGSAPHSKSTRANYVHDILVALAINRTTCQKLDVDDLDVVSRDPAVAPHAAEGP